MRAPCIMMSPFASGSSHVDDPLHSSMLVLLLQQGMGSVSASNAHFPAECVSDSQTLNTAQDGTDLPATRLQMAMSIAPNSSLAGSLHPGLICSLVDCRVSSGKLDSGLTGGSEPRRSSARAPKRKTPARQDRDEEASLTSRSARANSSAGEATPFSPPTLVWESQPLYQVDAFHSLHSACN